MNVITATTAACSAVSGGRVRVRAAVGLVRKGRATSRSLAALGMTSMGRTLSQALYHRDAQGWRPVDAVLALGIAARSQCCPSKHPDGYREVVIRR